MPKPKLGSLTYLVKQGDSLPQIARQFNTSVQILRKFNFLPSPAAIYPGESLIIPVSPADATVYTIKAGETLCDIARRYETSVHKLIDYNYLKSTEPIYPGQEFVVA